MASFVRMGRVAAVSIMSATALLPQSGDAQGPQAAYPSMAPIDQYRMAPSAEIALAKSAAPASISGDADVLVLGATGYERVAKGRDGFVCIVVRSWAKDLSDPDFWNPKTRGPICYNAPAARSVLPMYLSRTEWVLSGLSKSDIQRRAGAALKASDLKAPDVGAMCYMLSKDGYLGDDVHGPWHPHLMFFQPRTAAAEWGANLAHSPVFLVDSGGAEPFVVFAVPVPRWSDGTRDSTTMHDGAIGQPRDGRTSRQDWLQTTDSYLKK